MAIRWYTSIAKHWIKTNHVRNYQESIWLFAFALYILNNPKDKDTKRMRYLLNYYYGRVKMINHWTECKDDPEYKFAFSLLKYIVYDLHNPIEMLKRSQKKLRFGIALEGRRGYKNIKIDLKAISKVLSEKGLARFKSEYSFLEAKNMVESFIFSYLQQNEKQ